MASLHCQIWGDFVSCITIWTEMPDFDGGHPAKCVSENKTRYNESEWMLNA